MRKTPELQRFLFSSPFPSRKTNMETFPGYLSISSTENKWRFYLSWFAEDIRNHVSLPPPKILFFFLFFPYILSFYSHPKKFTIFAHHLIIFWYYLDFLFLAFLNISLFFTSVSNIVFLTSCFIYLFFCTHQKVHICSGTNSKPHHKMMLYDMFKVGNWESHQCLP